MDSNGGEQHTKELPIPPSGGTTTFLSQDDHLRCAISQFGFRNWYDVAEHFDNIRPARDYKSRWSQLQRNCRRGKQHWQPSEDSTIQQFVRKFGPGNWGQIAKNLPGRTSKQCRERWRYHLDPTVSRAPWTEEENTRVVHLQQQHGNRWTKIARELCGRTDHAVRNHWHFSLLPKLKRANWTANRRRLWDAGAAAEGIAEKSKSEVDAMAQVLADTALADAVIRSLEDENVIGEQSSQQSHAR